MASNSSGRYVVIPILNEDIPTRFYFQGPGMNSEQRAFDSHANTSTITLDEEQAVKVAGMLELAFIAGKDAAKKHIREVLGL